MNRDFRNIIRNTLVVSNEPNFFRIIGIDCPNTYNDILKEIKVKIDENKEKSIIFDSEIKLNAEMELINYIYSELSTMDIYNINHQDIVIFDDNDVNNKFLNALQYVVNLAINNENFFNINVRNNFITKVIVWVYTYIKEIDFKEEINPLCLYYGQIQRHEIYFLLLLRLMEFDVLYINPLKEEYFDEIDVDNITSKINYIHIGQIDTFENRCEQGNLNDNIETSTKQIHEQIHEELFVNTGIYKPWQYRGGFTESMRLDTILEDIYIYLHEPTKLREGFKVNDNIVSVPCFFYKIDGEYNDILEYKRLVDFCIKNKEKTLFLNDIHMSENIDSNSDMYKLMFCQLSDATFDIEEVKKSDLYKYSRYSIQTQDFILNKFNEVITKDDLYNIKFDKEDILRFLVLILNLDEDIIRLIDGFDFLHDIPKIVIYLDLEEDISEDMLLILGYLHNIGMDIIIFNPSGMCNVNNVIDSSNLNISRLDKINYKSKYSTLKALNTIDKIENIFSRIFK